MYTVILRLGVEDIFCRVFNFGVREVVIQVLPTRNQSLTVEEIKNGEGED